MIEDRGPELATVLIASLVLTWLFVSLRVYVKACITKSWGADDHLLIASLLLFTTYATCALYGIPYGTGKHVQDIPISDIPIALETWWLCELFYAVTTTIIRLSIAVFLLRICVQPEHKHVIYATIGVLNLFAVVFLFVLFFQCTPIGFFWGQYAGVKGSCINPAIIPNLSIAHSALSFTADWILGLLPIVLIYDLQMNIRTKLSIGGILSLGLLAGLATLIRIPYIKSLAITDDFLFATSDVAIWSTIEPALGIIAAAAATLRPLFKSFYNLSSNVSAKLPTYHGHTRNSASDGVRKLTSWSSSSTDERDNLKVAGSQGQGMGLEMRMPTSTITTSVKAGKGRIEKDGIRVLRTVEISSNVEEQNWAGRKRELDMV